MGRNHKAENTFKFRTFSERLGDVQIDVVRRTRRLADVPDDADTFFGEALQKWSDLNRTQHFISFRGEISDQVQSLAQLVYHRDSIVDILEKHLSIEGSMAAPALTDLLVHLARDLQQDFYPYLPRFFTVLVRYVMKPPQDVDLLEACFTALALLFKIMWREMVNDMNNVLDMYAPLFSLQKRDHIKRFAAESMAYVLRKVNDRQRLFTLMFERLCKNENEVDGYGLILFDMMKGVKNQLHSCTEAALPLLLDKLDSQPVLRTLEITYQSLVDHADVEHVQIVWNVTLDFIDKMLNFDKNSKKVTDSSKQVVDTDKLSLVLKLVYLMVHAKGGKTVKSEERLKRQIVAIVKLDFHENCHSTLLDMVTCLLENSVMQMIYVREIVTTIYRTFETEVIFKFTRRIFAASCFEQIVLIPFLNYCHQLTEHSELEESLLEMMTGVVLTKCPIPETSEQDQKLYILDFSSKLKDVKSKKSWIGVKLMRIIDEFIGKKVTFDETSLCKLWSVLVILPNIRPIPQSCNDEVAKIMEKLLSSNSTIPGFSAVLLQCMLTLDHVTDHKPHLSVNLRTIIGRLKTKSDDVNFLRTLDLCVNRMAKSKTLDDDIGLELIGILNSNFSSCYRLIRLLTVRILSKFDFVLPPHDDPDVEQISVFRICVMAEKVPLTVNDYRNKQFHLSKLEYGHVQRQLPIGGQASDVPLRFLIGSMYNNFSLLWLPIRGMIETHAHDMSRDQFWSIYGEHLEQLATLNERKYTDTKMETDDNDRQCSKLNELFFQTCRDLTTHKDNPDHGIVRYHLWKSMQQFAPLCETKSKTLCPLLFRFLENEYYQNEMDMSPSQDLRKDQVFDEEDLTDEMTTENTKKSGKKRVPVSKYLVAHVELFSKFKSPKSMTMESRLLELYYKLLSHRYQQLQKVALDCLMTYKYPFLVPYRENLYRLLDDSHFKDEIVLFSLADEHSEVENDHREQLMPVLMRLLYGRMMNKTGKETSGKQNAALRKSLVLRFLGGCRQEELSVFMELVFGTFNQYRSENLSEKLNTVLNELEISSVIPIRQQQSAMHTMDLVFSNLGNSIDLYLSQLFHIVVCVTAVSIRLLDDRDNLVPQSVNSLKTLRTLGMTRITQFFTLFAQYTMPETEIEGLLTGVIWPQLLRLPNEGIYSPTPLLKLMHLWSTEMKYFRLLDRKVDDTQSALTLVFQLLLSSSVHVSVTSMVMDIVDNLLNLRDENEMETDAPRKNRRLVEVLEPGPGVPVLLPHVPTLLTYLHNVVKKMTSRGTRKFSLPTKDIRILAQLSGHVTESKHCGDIVSLLIPFLAKRAAKDESMEIDVLASVQHLLAKTDNPEEFLLPLAKLFSIIDGRLSRRSLCDVIQAAANHSPERKKMADVVSKLNAWDKRRLDEVDYDSRLDAYVEVNDYVRDLRDVDVDVTFLAFVIHNASFFLKTSTDMSLRDSASNCLQLLVERLGQIKLNHDDYQKLVDGLLLPQIRSGLKVVNETPRNAFVQILSLSVTSFPQNKMISPLADLMNTEDVELDFFLNITHIQMHRRARAMRRLIQLLPNLKTTRESLCLYILPLVSHFLSDAYIKHHAVIDAAVECVGAISGLLPWSKYSQVLKNYLGQLVTSMSMQKVMVRAVVAVLDNFHFDIASVQDEKDHFPSVKVPEKDTEKTANDAEEKMEEPEEEDEDEEDIENTVVKHHLTPAQLKQIHDELLNSIVPQLKKALAKKAKSDDEHKKTKSKYAEDEEILRVPIALALVKLLQQFPMRVLKTHLPGVLLKVCEFLRSRAKDIRDTARDTLTKILNSLGHTYLPFILTELHGALQRGYQVHVLVYTVVVLLTNMKPLLKTGMLDSSLSMIVGTLNQELFGDIAQEKEVAGITTKYHEAKTIKSYDGYEILATFVGREMLGKLLMPLKEVLDTTNSRQTNKKAEEVLKRVTVGLTENKDLDVQVVMIFIHGVLTDSLPFLKTKSDPEEKKEVKPGQQPPSALLLKKPAPRGGLKPKISKKTNSNILVEFGLQLLNQYLKRSRLQTSNLEHQQLLDPFVTVLSESLESTHIRVIAWAVRCLTWILNAELPSLRTHVSQITGKLFFLLKDYSSSGAAVQGENQELVVACFKAVTVLVRDVSYHTISPQQIRVLLLYVEEDIHDNSRRATALTLLRAILIRRLMIPEMNDVMMKICKLAVTSDSSDLRQKCRQVILKFLLDYPLGKKVKTYLEFFVAQLTYEMESGRESVLEMMASLFTNFPQTMMDAYSLLFFMPLATRLINDEATRCRKLVSLALKALLSGVSDQQKDEIINMIIAWSNDSNPLHEQLSMNLLGLVVEVEQEKFEKRVTTVLPIIADRIQLDRFPSDADESKRNDLDKVLYAALNCLLKILTNCPSVIRSRKLIEICTNIWEAVCQHLLYPHQWVRFLTAQLFGALFSSWTAEEVMKRKKKQTKEFLNTKPDQVMRALAGHFLKQLKDFTDEECGDQIIKNLVFVAKCIKIGGGGQAKESTEGDESTAPKIDWLIRKMAKVATYEGTQNVKSTLKRRHIYKWLAAVANDLGKEDLPEYLRFMLPPLVRDTNDNMPNLDETLKSLAQEVLDFMKGIVGVETFLNHYRDVQKGMTDRREKRKREQLIQTVSMPEIASRKRIKKNLQKRDAKKRKIATMRPTRGKKRKTNDGVAVDM